MVTTEAWVIHQGPEPRALGGDPPPPAELVLDSYSFPDLADDEVLVEPLYACWEANMTHALERQPVDICRQRGEERIVLGNAAVVRVLRPGPSVTLVSEGDVCLWLPFGRRDAAGYMELVHGYDAPGTVGVLARRTKIRQDCLLRLPEATPYSLQQCSGNDSRLKQIADLGITPIDRARVPGPLAGRAALRHGPGEPRRLPCLGGGVPGHRRARDRRRGCGHLHRQHRRPGLPGHAQGARAPGRGGHRRVEARHAPQDRARHGVHHPPRARAHPCVGLLRQPRDHALPEQHRLVPGRRRHRLLLGGDPAGRRSLRPRAARHLLPHLPGQRGLTARHARRPGRGAAAAATVQQVRKGRAIALEHGPVARQLIDYISDELLGDPGAGVELDTTLLEWGVLNSLNISRLIVFVGERFDVEVPPEAVVGANFKSVRAVADMVLAFADEAAGATAVQGR